MIAKPAEQTPLIGALAVELMHKAGIPRDVVQLAPGAGSVVGGTLTAHPLLAGVVFTGSTETARRSTARSPTRDGPIIPFIAETGGQNAMIVDSSALPEQVTRDVISSRLPERRPALLRAARAVRPGRRRRPDDRDDRRGDATRSRSATRASSPPTSARSSTTAPSGCSTSISHGSTRMRRRSACWSCRPRPRTAASLLRHFMRFNR